ncbi:DUF6817 domain-containing protein [Herbaspirillum huttiense]|uniref:DUF6817 domain-containing protein n=1 Tax=Herbaspirillum huttiense TaxID=863372 RepID=UPI0031CEAA9A
MMAASTDIASFSGSVDTDGLPNQLLDLLRQCGATQRPHSGRMLFDHLVGTYNLLRAWGNSSTVCLGGLFHSIYGTNVFRQQSLYARDRSLLQHLIGEKAESLAWDFCHVDRPAAIIFALQQGDDCCADEPDWIALAEIEVANLLEQGNQSRALRQLYFLGMERHGALSSGATSALKNYLSAQLRMGKKLTLKMPGVAHTPEGRDE